VLADLATDRGEVDLLDTLLALRSHPSQRDGKPLGSRTVWNLASIVRVFFADALERKKIRRDPTLGWRADRHLPRKEDKEKGWRQRAGFTLAQAVKLTADPRIPEDRRVLYALRFLGGGLRPGEAANARWRELDRTAEPLWRLSISSAFNTHELQEKATKTGAELNVPVHPVLQRALAAWWDTGWARLMGREPTQDDLIVPRPEGGQRRVTTTLLQFYADLAAVGLPKQRQYESRSTFRNLALRAGASEFHVNLITHPKPQKAADFYTRLEQQWEGMCRAVLAIDAGAWAGCAVADGAAEPASAPRRVVTVQGYSPPDPYASGWEIPKKNAPPPLTGGGAQMVTPTGFEPMFST
jgi:integrase